MDDKKKFALRELDKRNMSEFALIALKNELQILRDVNFSHIVSLVDVFENGRKLQMVMELCEAGNLSRIVSISHHKRLSEQNASQILCTVAQTLKYLHSHSVVHRNLKPGNILFTKEGVVKITDFTYAHSATVQGEAKQSLIGTQRLEIEYVKLQMQIQKHFKFIFFIKTNKYNKTVIFFFWFAFKSEK